jgi:branched-chain amino acid transport system substrate-binding protein
MRKGLLAKLTVVVTVLVLIATPALGAKKKTLKIGLLYALSGLAAVYTKGTVIGHEIAAEEINAKGGVLGKKITFVVRDNKLKPGIAVKEFRRMVTRDQVDFVMGIISSGVALAVSQVAKEMQVLFVDTIAQTSALTEEQGHRYVVRTNTNSTVIGRTAALAAAKRSDLKRFYFIGPDYEWGHVVNNDFWTFLQTKRDDVEKLGDLWPKLGERDFSSHITTMMNTNPDAVFSSLWGGDLIAFIKQAKAYGFFDKVQFISTGAGDLDILKPMGMEMPNGLMATFLYAFDWLPVKQQENQKFIAEFKKRAGYEPKSGDIIGYISTYMIAEAIEKAGTTDMEKVIDTLHGMRFNTLLGDVTVRDFDGQSTFSYNTGYTYSNPCYPAFKRLKDVTRAEGTDVLHSKMEVEKIRAEYKLKN